MNWEDEGYLLSKRKFRENANIINVFTNLYGKISGIVYGGNSRKIRNYLQVGNKIFVIFNSKNENKIGYLKTELINPISPKYFNDKKRTSCLLSATSILNILLPESQKNINIYNSLEEFFKNIDINNWIVLYIYWELNLIKELGFGLDFKDKNTISSNNEDLIKINIDGTQYEVPSYIFDNTIPDNLSFNMIKKSLTFTRVIMLNKFFTPSNLIFPKSRIILENYFN